MPTRKARVFLGLCLQCGLLLPLLLCVEPAVCRSQQAPEPASAGPKEADVFKLWLQRSREVASFRTQIGQARFDVVTSTLWPNPQLSVNTSVVAAGRDHPPDGIYNWGPSLNIPLPVLGQIAARRQEAVAALRVAELQVAATLWARAADLEQAMVERAFADADVKEIERNLGELARIDGIVRERANAGANSRYDVLRVSTSESTLRAALAAAHVKRDQAETQIVALIAAPEVTSVPVTRASLAGFHGPENETELIATALSRRPDLLLARRGVDAAQATAARYRREVWPVPSVQLGAYFTQQSTSTSLQGGIAFTVPLFDRNQGLIGRANATARGARSLSAALDARIRAEVRGAFRARASAERSLEQFRASGLSATAELLQRAEISYQAGGTFLILDLLDAYRAVWEARAQELELERSFADAEAELERAAALNVP
jgi:cobalt-zinc-cadmium efflux system outer membrane protein